MWLAAVLFTVVISSSMQSSDNQSQKDRDATSTQLPANQSLIRKLQDENRLLRLELARLKSAAAEPADTLPSHPTTSSMSCPGSSEAAGELLDSQGQGLSHHYCIVGGGPAGLQVAALLAEAKRDYMVFESASSVGSFFERYPRHRKLISINKINTGHGDEEFNQRHDWNSLLSSDPRLRFPRYSSDFWPSADTMVRYLRDFAHALQLNITHGARVVRVQRQRNQTHRFKLTVQKAADPEEHCPTAATTTHSVDCEALIVATGLSRPMVPPIAGIELAEGYEDVSTDPQEFANQSVLILGNGNAAFETATAIHRSAAFVNVLARSRIRLAWETHYPGDIRAPNNELLEAYHLKSLDTVAEVGPDMQDWQLRKQTDNCPQGRSECIQFVPPGLDEIIKRDDPPPLIREMLNTRVLTVDRVIRCLGWRFDPSWLHDSDLDIPLDNKKGKFPSITSEYEAVKEPGIFFAGSVAHSLDIRKSSGGFIHGFRYTARALVRILQEREHGVQWPASQLQKDAHVLASHMLKRINTMAGPYQMFGVLADVFVVEKRTDGRIWHFKEVPLQAIKTFMARRSKFSKGPTESTTLLTMQFAYGKSWGKPGQDVFSPARVVDMSFDHPDGPGNKQNFIHPVLKQYTPDFKLKAVHHMVEEPSTNWNLPETHYAPLHSFVSDALRAS